VAVTEPWLSPSQAAVGKALLAAASLLPCLPSGARAETAPTFTSVSYKYLDYLDFQPDAERVRVIANAVNVVSPINERWSFSAGAVTDAVSGASPRYYTSALTKLEDYRRAQNISLTRWGSSGSVTLSHARSAERDYISKSLGITGVWYVDDTKNTAVTAGLGAARDVIDVPARGVNNEGKSVNDFLLGVTQVLTRNDVGQLIARYTTGHGYYTDPYKSIDERPRERSGYSALVRWNHHFPSLESSVRSSYRWYQDSFGIRAHTLGFEYVQPLANGRLVVTPLVRWYTQTAANFYLPANPGRNGRTYPAEDAVYYSQDQRLSAFGAQTLGIKSAIRVSGNTWFDIKYEGYKQRGQWALAGRSDASLAPFNARSVQVGISTRF